MNRVSGRVRACLTGAALACAVMLAMPAFAEGVHVLYTVSGGTDGGVPYDSLITDKAGDLYGTTYQGGTVTTCSGGCGAVFKLAPDGTETVLHSFQGASDGAYPLAGVVADRKENLYGVTQGGDTAGDFGTVFKIAPDGTETVLHVFCSARNCKDGALPQGGLAFDQEGNLYGTTTEGGTGNACTGGCGTIFRVTPKGRESLVYSFQGGSDGSAPAATLLADAKGDFFGTTFQGGTNYGRCAGGCGTVFELSAGEAESVIYAFKAGHDGCSPLGNLIADKSGNLYGTTFWGGGGKCDAGCGTVFKVAPQGDETVLHVFTGHHRDGCNAAAGLITDRTGSLYGTTAYGGTRSCFCGIVFKLDPDRTETVLHAFPFSGNNIDGAYVPFGGLMADGNRLYGTTDAADGRLGFGVIYRLDK
ncbi:MAG: choice-of-anchor tandem repeat GloVer-containing protein [Rhizomicrobium sp.]